LVEWLATDGQRVAAGDVVAMVETSKATTDLVADAGGVLRHLVPAMSTCRPGDQIGRLFATEEDWRASAATAAADPAAGHDDGLAITLPARALMERHGIDPADLAALGKSVIRRTDIEDLLQRRDDAAQRTNALPAAQQAVAAAVSASHQRIPAAFSVVKVTGRWRQEEADRPVAVAGIPELVIKAIADVREEFPLCFSSLGPGNTVTTPAGAHIGVTVDVGYGLYVPVIHDADARSVGEIAAALLQARLKARRRKFTEADLTGANIVVTLHTELDVVLARPIIYPGHACALSVCALQDELYLDPLAGVSVRHFFYLGLAYDHRLINGRDAARFLDAVKSRLAT
jgi:2-oxoglutarate dehydrogenase E2 component (dihydrolipoamide succinyltransferase)